MKTKTLADFEIYISVPLNVDILRINIFEMYFYGYFLINFFYLA